MASERDMSRMMRQLIHKKQERSQTIQEGEPRLADLVEGVSEFRNVRDKGLVQYVRYRDDIFSINMVKESKVEDKYPKGSTLKSNGWDKLPSGLIIQWGSEESDAALKTVIFPIAFPNQCFNVTCTDYTDGDDDGLGSATGISVLPTKTKVIFSCYEAADNFFWKAIGY